MKNCQPSISRRDESSLELVISQEKPAFGVVDRLSISNSCSSGKVALKVIKTG
jgi:hypothetical protein